MSLDAMKQALELLESAHVATDLVWKRYDCITALRAAIEQAQEQETVMAEYKFQTYAAYKTEGEMKIGLVPDDAPLTLNGVPLYPHPRQWQGLTDEDVKSIWRDIDGSEGLLMRFVRVIEAKLKEKNT